MCTHRVIGFFPTGRETRLYNSFVSGALTSAYMRGLLSVFGIKAGGRHVNTIRTQ